MTNKLPFSNLDYHTEPASKAEIISLAATYYSNNPQRRGMKADGNGCVYQNEAGNRCAVGLFVTNMELIDEIDMANAVDLWNHTQIDDVVYPAYEGHSSAFWQELQNFHDHSSNFDSDGLTTKGKKDLEALYSRWLGIEGLQGK